MVSILNIEYPMSNIEGKQHVCLWVGYSATCKTPPFSNAKDSAPPDVRVPDASYFTREDSLS